VSEGASAQADVAITNKRGLHARASARFVTLASTFDAAITVTRDGACVTGTSIMGLMMLAAGPGETVRIAATGAEANAAVNALCALVESRFGEDR